jgi:hypothetical protein
MTDVVQKLKNLVMIANLIIEATDKLKNKDSQQEKKPKA